MLNQRSTPKKILNYSDTSNKRIAGDVIYSEMLVMKDELTKSFVNHGNVINRVEQIVDENTKAITKFSSMLNEVTANQKKTDSNNADLTKRLNELEIRMKNFGELRKEYETLKQKVDRICVEVNSLKETPNSMENIIRDQITNSVNKITSSIDENVDKISQLISDKFSLNTNLMNQMTVSDNKTKVNIMLSDIAEDSVSLSNSTNNESPIITENSDNCFNLKLHSAFNSNKDASQNVFLRSSPSKDTNKLQFGLQDVTNPPVSGATLFSGAKPTNSQTSLFGVPKSIDNQGSGQPLFGGSKSVVQGSGELMFGVKSQTNKIFGDFTDTNKAPNGESIFGLKTQPIKIINKEPSDFFGSKSSNQTINMEQTHSNKPFSFNSAVSSDTPSFSSLSKSAIDSHESASRTEATWQGGSKLFGSKLNTSENNDENSETNLEEEHDPHFQPIIDLPPLVILQKDEESHDILFKSRCKLYRFINNEWKERGVGEMKIMQTKASVDKLQPVKLLMRRDQVRKICCNQRISKNVPSFTDMPNVKSTCWVGNDFSESEPSQEKFAIRFSNVSELTEFKKVVEKVQSELSFVEKSD